MSTDLTTECPVSPGLSCSSALVHLPRTLLLATLCFAGGQERVCVCLPVALCAPATCQRPTAPRLVPSFSCTSFIVTQVPHVNNSGSRVISQGARLGPALYGCAYHLASALVGGKERRLRHLRFSPAYSTAQTRGVRNTLTAFRGSHHLNDNLAVAVAAATAAAG